MQAEQDVSLVSSNSNLNIAGNVYAGGGATLTADQGIAISDAFVGALGDVELSAGGDVSVVGGAVYSGLEETGELSGTGSITANAGEALNLQSARLLAAGNVDANADDISADVQSVVGGEEVSITARGNIRSQGFFSSTQSLRIEGGQLVSIADAQAGTNLSVSGNDVAISGEAIGIEAAAVAAANSIALAEDAGLLTNGVAALDAAIIDNAGGVLGVAGIEANVSVDLNNTGSFASGESLNLNAGNTLSSTGQLSAQGEIALAAQQANLSGSIVSDADIGISADQIDVDGVLSSQSNVSIASGSDLELGDQAALTAVGDLALSSAGSANLSGEIFSAGELSIDAGSGLTSDALVQSVGQVDVSARNLDIAGELRSNEAINLAASETINLGGVVASVESVTLDAERTIIADSSSQLLSGGSVTIASGEVAALDGVISAGNTAQIEAISNLAVGGAISAGSDLALTSNDRLGVTGSIESGQNLSVTASDLDFGGSATALGDLTFAADQVELQPNALVQAVGNVSIEAQDELLSSGAIIGEDGVAVSSGRNLQLAGSIQSGSELLISAAQVTSVADLLALGSVSLQSAGDVDFDGALTAIGSIAFGGRDFRFGQNSRIQSEANIALDGKAFDLAGNWISLGAITLEGARLDSAAALLAETGVNLSLSDGIALLSGSEISTSGPFEITADDFSNTGILISGSELSIAGSEINNSGQIAASGALVLEATGSLISSGALQSELAVDLVAGGLLGIDGNVLSGGDIALKADRISVDGAVQAQNGLSASSASDIAIGEAGGLFAGTDLQLNAGQEISNSGIVSSQASANLTAGAQIANLGIIEAGGVIALSANNIDLGGSLQAIGAVSIAASDAIRVEGELLTDGRLSIDANRLLDTGATQVFAAQEIDLTALSIRLGGQWSSGSSFSLLGDAVDVSGLLAAVGDLDLQASSLLSISGDLISEGTIALSSPIISLDGSLSSGTSLTIDGDELTIGTDAAVRTAGLLALASSEALTFNGLWAGGLGVDIRSGADLSVVGRIESGREAYLEAAENIDVSGVLITNSNVELLAASIDVSGALDSGGEVSLTSLSGGQAISGGVTSLGDLSIVSSGQLSVSGAIASQGHIALEASQGQISGSVFGAQSLSIDVDTGLLTASLDSGLESAGGIVLVAGALDHSGAIAANGDIALDIAGLADVSGSIASGNDIAFNSGQTVISGELIASGNLGLAANTISAGAASALQANSVSLEASDNIHIAGLVFSESATRILAGNSFANSGRIEGRGVGTISANALTLGGSIAFEEALVVSSNSLIELSGQLASNAGLTLNANEIVANSATELFAGGNLEIAASSSLNLDGQVAALGQIQIGAGAAQIFGSVSAGDQLIIETVDALTISGDLSAETGLSLGGEALNLSGTAASLGDIAIAASVIQSEAGSLVQSDANVTLISKLGQNLSGAILARGDAAVLAGESLQIDGAIETGGTLSLDTSADISGSGAVFGTRGLQVSAAAVDWSGEFLSAGTTNIDVQGTFALAGELLANGDTSIAAQAFNLDGTLITDGALSLRGESANILGSLGAAGQTAIDLAGSLVIGDGAAFSGGNIVEIDAASLTNQGLLAAAEGLSAEVTDFLINSGRIESAGDLELNAADDLTSSGAIIALGSLSLSGDAIAFSGQVQGQSAVTIEASELTLGGALSSAGSLDIAATGPIASELGSETFAVGALTIASGEALDISGNVIGEHTVSFNAVSDLTLSGLVQAGGAASAGTGSTFELGGTFQSLDHISISAEALALAGVLASDKNLNLDLGSAIFVSGSRAIGLSAIDADIAGQLVNEGSIGTNGSFDATLGSGVFAGSLFAGGDVTIASARALDQNGDWFALGGISLQSNADITLAGDIFSGSTILVVGDLLRLADSGAIEALGALGLSAAGDLTSQGTISANGAVDLSAGGDLLTSGIIASAESIILSAGSSLLSDAQISSAGMASLSGDTVDLSGSLVSDDQITVVARAGALNIDGVVTSTDDILLSSNAGLAISGLAQADQSLSINATSIELLGQVYGLGSIDIATDGSLSLASGSELASLGDIALTLGELSNNGIVDAGGSLAVDIAGDIENEGTIFAASTIELAAGAAFSNSGVISGDGDVEVSSEDAFTNEGQLFSFSNLSVTGGSSSEIIGLIYGEDGLAANFSGNVITGVDSQISSFGDISLVSDDAVTLSGAIGSGGALSVSTARSMEIAGLVQAEGELGLSAENISLSGSAFSSTNAIVVASGEISIEGQLSALETLELAGSNIDIGAAATLLSNSSIEANATGLLSNQGLISAIGDVDLTAQIAFLGGRIETAGSLSVNTSGFIEQLGTLEAASGLSLGGDSIEISGSLLSLDHLSITADTDLFLASSAQLASVSVDGVNSASNNIALNGGAIALGGRIDALGDVSISSTGALGGTSLIVSEGDLELLAAGANTVNGEYFASGDVIVSGGTIDTDANATALGKLSVESSIGDIDLAGSYQSVGDLEIISEGGIALAESSAFAASGVIYSEGAISLLASGGVENSGVMGALGDLEIQTGALVNNLGVLSGERLLIDSPSFVSTGTLISTQSFELSGADLAINGSLISGGDIDLQATSGDLTVNAELAATNIALASDFGDLFITTNALLSAQETIAIGALGNVAIGADVLANQAINIASTDGAITIASETQVQSALGVIDIAARGAITNGGLLAAGGPITIDGGSIFAGRISSDGALNLIAQQEITANQFLDSLAAISLRSTSGSIAIGNDGGIIASDAATLEALSGTVTSSGIIVAGYENNAGVEAYNGGVSLAASVLDLGGFVGANALTLDAQSLEVVGTVLAGGSLAFVGDSIAIGADGHLHSAASLDLDLQSFENFGNLTSDGSISVASSAGISNSGFIISDGALALLAQSELINTGTLSAASDLTLNGDAVTLAGLTSAIGDIESDSQSLTVTGTIVTDAAISFNAADRITIGVSGIIDAGGLLALESVGDITANGILVGDGDLSATSGGVLEVAGQLASFDNSGAADSISLTAQAINVSGLIQSGSGAQLSSLAGDIDVSGALVAQSGLTLSAAGGEILFAQAAEIFSGGDFKVLGDAIRNQGTLSAIGNVDLESRDGTISLAYAVLANGNIAIDAGAGAFSLGVLLILRAVFSQAAI